MITPEFWTEPTGRLRHSRTDFEWTPLCAAETAPCECPDACERDHTNE